MSRSSTRKQSYTTNSDSDNDSKQTNKGFSRPKSAVTTNTKAKKNSNDDSLSDKSYEFKSNNNKKNSLTDTKSSFFERITGSDKYSSDSDTQSVTKTPTNIDNKSKSNKSSSNNNNNTNKNEFLKPHKKQTKYSSESSSVDSSTDVSLASDRPAPKNSQTLRSRSNSTSSVQRKNKNSDTDKDSSVKNKNDRKKRNSSSSSSSSSSTSSSYSNSSSIKKNNKKQLKSEDDSEDEEYHKGHVTKVKVNVEKKPPIDMSKWTKSGNRPSSSLEKPSDSMSDSSDTRRSISINDIPSKSHQNHKQNRSNNRKLNQTFDLELENESSSNEMTDVSPLPTPKDRKASNKKEAKRNSMDMSSFYKILNEDINKRMDSVFSIFNDKFAKNSSKTNLKTSFDLNNSNSNNNNNSSTKYSTKINKIDAENERLYAKLMSTSQKTSSLSRNDSSFNNKPIRLTSSALNRQREQQRIEKENQQILKRLLKVKATKYLVKEEQIKDYDKKFGGLTSLNQSRANSSHSMPLGFVNSTTSMGALSHNTSVLSTKRSAKSTANNSRLSSAKSMNKSNHHISIDANELLKRAASAGRHRPEWIERW